MAVGKSDVEPYRLVRVGPTGIENVRHQRDRPFHVGSVHSVEGIRVRSRNAGIELTKDSVEITHRPIETRRSKPTTPIQRSSATG